MSTAYENRTSDTSATTSAANASSEPQIGVEDVFPVRSRINWGPILGGAFVALALYFVLTLLGTAAGFTIVTQTTAADSTGGRNTLAVVGAIWMLFTTIAALFVGGWVTSQLSVGETPKEAAVYGIILWGTVLAMLMFMLAAGVRAGFTGMVGMATITDKVADRTDRDDWRDMAERAGYPRSQIDKWIADAKDLPRKVKEAADDPAKRQEVGNTATAAAWWALAGTLLSMGAAIGGAVVGAGPRFRLMLARLRRPATVQV
ncbi:MAG: hypothetical protein K2W96_12750 [Gemmataceae bacterium]|nr:hypothetical protein [Gemmataceae bacterium]